jgi:hypothetical protein
MRRTVGGLARRYAVAWGYLVALGATSLVYAVLPDGDRAAVLRWTSTNVHNLHADPVGCLITSAFIPSGSAAAWPALIALALFGACRVLGNWRTAVVCGVGHVIGTLVSEGIVGYRVTHGGLPVSARYITDVGPSYVVTAAIAVALLYGGWVARAAAALDLAVLVFVGDIFGGLTSLQVAAVGHATAIVTGALAGGLALWQRRCAPAVRMASTPAATARDQAARVRAAPDQAAPDQAAPDQAAPDQAARDQAAPAAAGLRDSRDPRAPGGPDEPRDPDQAAQPRPMA